jgi:hypothetical protein
MKPYPQASVLTALLVSAIPALAQDRSAPELGTYPVIPVQSRDIDRVATMIHGLQPAAFMLGHGGKWMAAYEYGYEKMNRNLDGTGGISEGEILQNYFAAPTKMSMQMHMGMLMYAATDDLALMATLPYLVKSMEHLTADGERFNERTSGIGDVGLRAQYVIYAQPDLRHRVLLNAGLSLPTGSIDERMNGMRLEYPMQLGAGTVSLIPGVAYLGQAAQWGWGVEFLPNLRIGDNDNGYRLGNDYRLGLWMIRRLNEVANASARVEARRVENIRGADAELDPADEPTKDASLQGGKRLDFLVGFDLRPGQSPRSEHQRVFLEVGAPVYQDLDGPQLKTTFLGRLNWQWRFL